MTRMRYWRWVRRDSASREQLLAAAEEFCQRMRKVEEVLAARHFWAGPSEVILLFELGPGAAPGQQPDVAAAKYAMDDVARLVGFEEWAGIA